MTRPHTPVIQYRGIQEEQTLSLATCPELFAQNYVPTRNLASIQRLQTAPD